MIGVILAAGMAKRLRPLTDTKPKCLLKVGERTLLERTVDAMRQAPCWSVLSMRCVWQGSQSSWWSLAIVGR